MLKAMSRLLSELLRLTAIVAGSVISGLVVALLSRNVEGPLLEIVAFFAVFTIPVTVAWLLFRTIPSSYRNAVHPGSETQGDGRDEGHADHD
jgi:hypothetical protein